MTSDRGIDLGLPRYEDQGVGVLVSQGDLVHWEALYQDGTTLRSDLGGQYAAIDRTALRSFRFVFGGELLAELFPPEGRTGLDLLYRRRIAMGSGGREGLSRHTIHLAGYAPGPWLALDMDNEHVYTADLLHWGAKYGAFDPVVPMPMEGEHFQIQVDNQPLLAP
jgi:hypothetical protein